MPRLTEAQKKIIEEWTEQQTNLRVTLGAMSLGLFAIVFFPWKYGDVRYNVVAYVLVVTLLSYFSWGKYSKCPSCKKTVGNDKLIVFGKEKWGPQNRSCNHCGCLLRNEYEHR